jgi:ribosomal protein S18 acetylase RimI-like enzyme
VGWALSTQALQVITKEMLQRDGTPVAGLVCVETMTEFVPKRRGGAGMPDPQWAPRRFRRREIAYISDLAVRPTMRGAGVGGQLLAAAEEEAKSWGCRAAMLHVNVTNAAALALYRHRGYRPVCVEKNPRWVLYPREEFLMYKRFVQDGRAS